MVTLAEALAQSVHESVPYVLAMEKRDNVDNELYCIQHEDKHKYRHKQSTSSSAYSDNNNSIDSITASFEPVVHTIEHAGLTDAGYRSLLLPRWATVAARRADGVSSEQEQKAWRRELRQWSEKGIGLVQKRRESEWEILRSDSSARESDEGLVGEVWAGERWTGNKRRVSGGVAESVKKVKRSFGSFSESLKEFFLRKDSGGSASSAGSSGRFYARGEDGLVGDRTVRFALEPAPMISTPSTTGSLDLAAFWSSRISVGDQSPRAGFSPPEPACEGPNIHVNTDRSHPMMSLLDARGLSPLDTSPPPDQSQINELSGKLAQAVINASNEKVFDDGRRLNHLATGRDARRHRDSEAWEASRSLRELVRNEARERNRVFGLWDGEGIKTRRRGSSVDALVLSGSLCRRVSLSRKSGSKDGSRRSLTGLPRQRLDLVTHVDVSWRSDDNLCRPYLLK